MIKNILYSNLKKKYLNDFRKINKISKELYTDKKIYGNVNLYDYVLNIADNLVGYNDTVLFSSLIYNIHNYTLEKDLEKLNLDKEILEITKDYYFFNFPKVLFLDHFDPIKYKSYLAKSFTRVESLLILFSECLVIFDNFYKIRSKKFKKIFLDFIEHSIIPLASALGIFDFKNKIQNELIKVKYPKDYYRIKFKMNILFPKKKLNYLKDKICKIISSEELVNNALIETNFRYKNIGSVFSNIYITKKETKIKDIKDIFAIRFIFKTKKDCYRCFNLLSTKFEVISFKNFIKKPKFNNYQSIHLNIIINNFPVEVQIRTKEMHENAEYGLASHFKYKFDNYLAGHDQKLVRIIKNSNFNFDNKNKIYNSFFCKDSTISVFTNKYELKEIPRDISVFEFCFYLHSDFIKYFNYAIINGEKVNNKDYILKNLDHIDIIKSKKITLNKKDIKYIKDSKNIRFFKSILKKQNVYYV